MAIGFSGSNGGITNRQHQITLNDLELAARGRFFSPPLEVSYFANNVCNLRCQHCYVGYEREDGGLDEAEWVDVFEQCLALGALTFGNVGKEPTLCWDKSVSLMRWLAERRRSVTRLRFGLVTNAVRLDERKAADLVELAPDYLDISLDGVGETHDAIRGKGSYRQTTRNIAALPPELREKVFISFTANEWNADSLPALVREVARLGVKNMLVSPYVSRENRNPDDDDALLATDHRLVHLCSELAEGRLVDFSGLDNFNIYVKNDYTTRLSLMNTLAQTGVINFANLWEDDYGVIFTPYKFGTNQVYFSYLPFETTFRKAIRFSHDGFIGNCYDMFFRDYTQRTVGNAREIRLADLYQEFESGFLADKAIQTKYSISSGEGIIKVLGSKENQYEGLIMY
ncbi:radical SAM protein [Methyloglobulus sp.]|uniref:radical SAM protein n=1 Tax=Methyloglobulus sp. TaxID=2518622 RepID=UPI003988DF5F